MKHWFIFLSTMAIFMFSSCSNDESDLQSATSMKDVPMKLSGTLTPENPVQTVKVGNRYVTLLLENSEQLAEGTRAIVPIEDPRPKPGEIGPFYAQGTPKEMVGKEFKNRKVFIPNTFGVPTGVYFGDVWETAGIIRLPDNAYIARVAFPRPSGFKNYKTLVPGVSWKLDTEEGDKISVEWSFYTFVLNFNAAGMRINEVVPIDGKKVRIPYFYKVD